MRPTPTTRAAAAVAAMAVLVGCSSGDATEDPTEGVSAVATSPSEDPSATPQAGASPTPTTTATEGMTIEQAQEIVDATTAVYNDAVTRMLTQQRIDIRWYEQMRAIYTDPMVEIIETGWQQIATRQFEGYDTEDPTGVVDTVQEVVVDAPECLVVRIERDFYGITDPSSDRASAPSDRYFIAFERSADDARDGAGTGWVRAWDAEFDEDTPTDLCERPDPVMTGDAA